ncbi:hypothetical protein ILUMI_25505 [Ignelater luminosus]|uniref:Acyltransferase n=1 Tax=Ignelater luminosus TaxID=2038154 RepID=A0A8K0FZL2_IGNLU|nr:hypothetical protein ILUMI_25505 [Ignelater luminosus]
MKALGIEFAPLNVPLRRRLQTLSIGFTTSLMTVLPMSSWLIMFCLILFSPFWLLAVLYLIWIWVFDKEVCEKGGRRIEWVRRWKIWKYSKEYFPINIIKDSKKVELDRKRNYLFCSFPHGLVATGAGIAFGNSHSTFQELFPEHTPHILTLRQNFLMPIFREYLLSVGACAASAKSINFLMSKPEGGNVALLVVGGAAESFYCKPGQYHLVLKNRKGFVKLALKNGSPLVPVFSFGETDIYDQVSNPEGSLLRRYQEWVKKITGIVPIIPLGRGFFQYSFGLLPQRKPINVIVGTPIDVEKVEDPTQEQIDSLHATFIKHLTDLFEEHKHKYLEKPEETFLVID